MTKQDWLTACVVAGGVAALTVAIARPPMGWAVTPAPPAAVPALPSAALSIPSLGAKVTAAATPDPGQPIKVKLTVKAELASAGTRIPVSVSIFSTSPTAQMSRVFIPPTELSKVDTSIGVDSDGNGSAVVQLPIKWAVPAPSAATSATASGTAQSSTPPAGVLRVRAVNYFMGLSSSLIKQPAGMALLQVRRQAAPK